MDNLTGVRIGIIGAGAIGGALIDRLLSGSGVVAENIIACDPNNARLDEIAQRFGVVRACDPAVAAAADIVVLAAPPLEIRKIARAIHGSLGHRPLVVSFAAAVSISLLESALPPGTPVVRLNPNSPLVVGAGYNPAVYGSAMAGAKPGLAETFLCLLGTSPVVPDTRMNLYTALTAVGPTYFLPVFDAIISAGIANGLSREEASSAAVATAHGCAEMVAQRSESPEQLKLLTGLRPLQDADVRELVTKAILEAIVRMDAVQEKV